MKKKLKAVGWKVSSTDYKIPEEIKVGDIINGSKIIEIKNLVNGKPTYASSFICEQSQDK